MSNESNELAVFENEEQALAALANLDLNVAGEENLQSGDLGMPPRLRLSQQNRPIEGTTPGQIVNTLTGAVYDSVEFVPMVFLPTTRVMWPEAFNADNQPVCVSDDGQRPLKDMARVTDPRSGPCQECLYAQFCEDGTPPICKAQRNFLALIVSGQDYEPVILTMQSTAIAAAKQLTSLAKMAGLRKSIVMGTKRIDSDKGTWFVPVFVMGSKLSTQQVLTAVDFRDDLKNLVISAEVVAENGDSDTSDAPTAPMRDEDIEVPF